MKLWCYDDYSGWGKALLPVAAARGHDARLFSDPTHPDEGAVFVRMHHHPDVRLRDKRVMACLALRPELTLIPDYKSSLLYDDKAEQARFLARWMPDTALVYSRGAAERALKSLGLPLMSKCSEGAGSHNVSFIDTQAKAESEMHAAFGPGLARHYGQRQTGYLLWQKFCAGNDYDFRVIAIGRERLILRRGNRKDRPMASGSNMEMPVTWPDAEANSVLDFANELFAAEVFKWCGIDVVRDHEAGRWVLLETTVGWPLGNMKAHRFVSGRPGRDYWNIVMDEIEAGSFAC